MGRRTIRPVTAERVDAGALWRRGLTGSARRVAEALRANGPRTRSELVTLTGLSRPTVVAGLTDLAGAGLVTEQLGTATRPVGGRPASVVRLTRAAGVALGVDIGRRHVRVAVADLGHEVLAEHDVRLAAEADDHPTEVLDRAARLVDEVLTEAHADRAAVVGVGFGIPAPITRQGRIGSPALLESARLTRPDLTDIGELVHHANDGDPGCRRLLIDAGTQLGFALGGLVNLLNPHRIVLGGELSTAVDLLRAPLQRGLSDTAMAAAVGAVEVVPGQLGPRAAALGGVALILGADTVALPTPHPP